MSLAIANRYARALADVVMTPGSGLEPQDAIGGLRDFAGSLASSGHTTTSSMTVPNASTRRT